MPSPDFLLPDGISVLAAAALVLTSFFTSALSAAMGIGGGTVLLAVMSLLVPIGVVVPVHGVVQLGSNVSRALIQWRHARLSLVLYFTAGCVLGAVVGGRMFVSLPEPVLIAAIGLFILWSAWGRLRPIATSGRGALFVGGAVATVITMFVGATGPLVLALFRRFDLAKGELIGTHSVAMIVQNGLKILVFGTLGFAFGAWLPLMLAMVVFGFVGTYAGSRLLHRLPEETFRKGLRIVLTLIAIELLVTAVAGLF